jgi:putative beta-lysine N-acetyltransferase
MTTSADRVTALGGSTVQHGPLSNRVYLMHLDPGDCPQIVDVLDDLAARRGYTKVFAKVPARETRWFLRRGYSEEAVVPGFFAGREDGVFLGKFLCSRRREPADPGALAGVVRTARAKAAAPRRAPALARGLRLAAPGPEHAEAMAGLYARVFVSYPFPIHDAAYLRRAMEQGVVFMGAWHDGELVGLASAEPDYAARNAEMTDFAVLPRQRGNALARHLLRALEAEMAPRGVDLFYTIARAASHGMNTTFARQGYRFAGTLVNNTHIAGGIESMNVWYRRRN